MAKLLSDDEVFGSSPANKLLSDEEVFGGRPSGPKSTIARQLADVPIGVAGGIAGLVNAGVGLGDIATGGRVGDAVNAMGDVADKVGIPAYLRPTQWQNQIQSLYTPEMQASKAAAHQSAVDAEVQAKDEGADWKGQIGASAIGALKGVAQNPRAGIAFITENYGGMKAIAKGTEKVLARYLPEIDAAVKAGTMTQAQADARIADLAGKISPVGEGILTMGQNAQQVREENPNATAGDYLLQVPAGIITGAIARGVGKIPGLENAETTMALNALGRNSGITGDAAKRVGKGILSEGVLQEVPQSAQEQVWQNLATGKPLQEGVGEQAVQGLVAGGAMGGGAAGMSALAKPASGPLQKALDAGGSTSGQVAQTTSAGDVPAGPSSIADTVSAAVAAENAASGQSTTIATPQEIATPAPTAQVTAAIPQPPVAAAQPNTPAAPEPVSSPVSTAAPTAQTNQAEPAGVPLSSTTQGVSANASQAQEAISPTPGRAAQSAQGARSSVPAVAAPPDEGKLAAFLSARNDKQLEYMATKGKLIYREAAKAEIARRAGNAAGSIATPGRIGAPETGNETGRSVAAAEFTNHDTKMTALVHPAKGGKFNVVLRDDDSGEFVQTARTGIPTLEKATAIAKQMAGITAARETPAGRPKPSPIMRRDDLVGAIMRVTGGDGIAANMAQTIGGDKANALTKLRGLFTNKGTEDLGDVVMHLRESEGYDVRDGEHLSELIRDASFGKMTFSMERQEREKEDAKELEYRDRIRAKAKKLGIKAVAVKFSDLDARVLAAEQARHDLAVKKLSERDRKRFEAAVKQLEGLVSDDEVRAILQDVSDRGMSGREKWKEALVLLRQFADDARSRELQGELDRATQTTEEPDWFKDFDEPTDRADGHGSAPAADHAGDGGRESDQGIAEQADHRERGGRGEVRPGNEGSEQGHREATAGELELTGQTTAEAAAVEAAKKALAEREAKDRQAEEKARKEAEDRSEIRRRSEGAAGSFELGGDAMANLSGQGDIFTAPEPAKTAIEPSQAESRPDGWRTAEMKARQVAHSLGIPWRGKSLSQIVEAIDMADVQRAGKPAPAPAQSDKDKAAQDLKDALGDLADIFSKNIRKNMMPEQEQKLFPVMVRVFDAAFRLGYHSFKDAARFVLQTIRDKISPEVADALTIDHLQGAYIAMSGGREGSSTKRDVIGVESKSELEQRNEPDERSGGDLERDRADAEAANGVGPQGVRPGPERNGGTGGPRVQGAESEGGLRGGDSLSGHEASPAGTEGDFPLQGKPPGPRWGSAGNNIDQRSGDLGFDGQTSEPVSAEAADEASTRPRDLAQKVAAQAAATTSPKASVKDALPLLQEGQQEDVFKTEKRFAEADGYGMLFTNGTGTGKSFTGLGVVKRFSNAGKNNILIVIPNDKIIEDWQKAGRFLGLDIHRLASTNDSGKGIVITTYANMGQNDALASREWDLVVHDEAHYLAQDKDGTNTHALKVLRALTLHPDGYLLRAEMLHRPLVDRIAELSKSISDTLKSVSNPDTMDQVYFAAMESVRKWEAELSPLKEQWRKAVDSVKDDVAARQGAARPRALFLSFTPFAYEPTIDWANGYLFDYNEGRNSEDGEFRGYNQGSNRDQFFMQHFGYRMRYGKLTKPDAKVDSGLMQRQFNSWLKKKGSLSGRLLDVAADYDRRFVLVDSAIGTRIDDALQWFEVKRKELRGVPSSDNRQRALSALRDQIAEKFDYLSRRYLLEAIKAKEVVPHVREHLAMGRKVVVFHDYKKGGGFNPFDVSEKQTGAKEPDDSAAQRDAYNSVVREFRHEFRDLIGSELFRSSSPIAEFMKSFPDVLLFNGDVPAQKRRQNVAKFQDDDSGPQVLLVQSAAGKEGISLHDTTGKHQRVMFNLGQPTQPTTAMQQEGRIYRIGQVTDAIFRYLNTGTNWEKWAFATTIAQRASAAENLGSGEQARALKDAFISGFEESGDYRAGMEGEGKGGKERDKAANDALTDYDRARSFYFGTQKKNSLTKSQEGADYFATPEPVGLKMVEWADVRPGDDVLEPSAGHGAIARWFPDNSSRTAIEPSMDLRPRLAMVFDGNIIGNDFESLNVVNKYDAIVMNPPFGVGGKTAIEHLAKAAAHLRDGGRIVALIPTGPAADKRFDKWMYEGEERAVKPIAQHPTLGPIYRGDTISTPSDFNAVVERVLSDGSIVAKEPTMRSATTHLISSIVKIEPTGPRVKTENVAKGIYLVANIALPQATFERAGTQVSTRIVVLEKQTDEKLAQKIGQQRNRDYTDAKDINALFNAIENVSLPDRVSVRKQDAEAPRSVDARLDGNVPEPGRVQPEGAGATVEKVDNGKLLTDAPRVEHVTRAGKTIHGVIAKTLTRNQAKAIDPFTWSKDGGFFIRLEYVVRPPSVAEQERAKVIGGGFPLFNRNAAANTTPADSAIYSMAQEGKTASEILSFISKASRRPFNRYLANALRNLGVSSTVTLDATGGWQFNQSKQGAKYAAAYNPKTDTVALFTPREAERHVLHELIHAATLKAIAKGGAAALQMRALFRHVQKSGALDGQYGMSNLDEFVAEAFSNPTFQNALKGVAASSGSKFKSAWQWLVQLVQRVLRLHPTRVSALDEAMTIGAQLMRENAALSGLENTGVALFSEGLADEIGRKLVQVAAAARRPGNTNTTVDIGAVPQWEVDAAARAGFDIAEYHHSADMFSIRHTLNQHGDETKEAERNQIPITDGDFLTLPDVVMNPDSVILGLKNSRGQEQVFSVKSMPDGTLLVAEEVRVGRKTLAFVSMRKVPGAKNAKELLPSVLLNVRNDAGIKPIVVDAPSNVKNGDIRFNIASGSQQQPLAPPVAPGNLWQRAKAKAAAVLSPENLDKAIYELQDKFIDLRRLRDHIRAIGGTITDMNDAYLGEELYHQRLAYRVQQFEKDELRPLAADQKARGITTDELETFLHARHAPEANAEMAKRNPNQAEIDAGQIKAARMVRNLELRLQRAKARGLATVAVESALNEARGELANWNGAQAFQGTEAERRSLSGMSDAAAAAIMAGLTPERRADLDALAARVDAINEGTLKLLDTYGLMSKASLNEWRNKYRYYIPLHRDEAHPDSVSHPIGQGFSTKGDAAKRRTGSNQKVTHILGHVAMQREAALTRGEKNHVMLKLYLMARQNQLPDVWKVGAVPTIDTIDQATGFVKSVPDPLYKTRPNVVMLRIAGKDVAITMNEHNPEALRMAQALKNLDVDELHYLIPVVGKMTRWFAAMNTQYNPIFGIINLIRDTQEAALNLSTTELAGKQSEVLKDTLSILKEVLRNRGRMPKTGKWAALFADFNEVGGTTGYRDLYLDAEARGKALLDTLKSLDRGKAKQTWFAVADWLSDYNEAMENATRLAAYKAALDLGMSKERAASLAKNLTVNFNRKGRQTRELGALYAFFNAAVQGTARMAQTLSGPAGRKIMTGGVLLGALNAMMGIAIMGGGGDDDDEWDKIPDFVKQRSLIIPIGKQDYISIPLPLGFQFLPNIGRLAVEMAVYKDKTAGKQMAALFSVLAEAFNPLGGNSPPMQIIAPTVMDPFVALAQNKDWTGKPIFIENRNSLDPQPGTKRAKDSATPWAKGLAEAINAVTGGTEYTPGGWSPTPDQIDFVIGQLTGGVGREAGKVAATAAAPFTGEELPPYKIPLVGRLYGSTAGHSGQSERFYENITRANEVENEIKGRAKDGFNVAEYLRENPGAIELAVRGNVAEKQISVLRKMRHEEIKADRPDSVSRVRAINEQMAGVMRSFNRDVTRIGAQ